MSHLSRSFLVALPLMLGACRQATVDQTPPRKVSASASANTVAAVSSAPPTLASAIAHEPPEVSDAGNGPQKVDFDEFAMGTNVRFVAYTTERLDAATIRAAMSQAFAEVERLEGVLSEWHEGTEVSKINASAGQWVSVGPETLTVITRALEAGKASDGAFDITFQAMSNLWKFGTAAEDHPKIPTKAEVEQRRKLVDYRVVEVDAQAHAVRIPKDHLIGLGGIAKGYIVDRAADVLRKAGLQAFLAQAGGDLFGAGRKPDGSPWATGIRDPRAGEDEYFATIELTDHAFSTAGDYARAYVVGGRRYHHIIDPRTGYPATESRSVTVWADDATTADAIDDAVFILGPERGLKLAEATPGVGVVIVDKHNKVWISPRLQGKVHVIRPPTEGI